MTRARPCATARLGGLWRGRGPVVLIEDEAIARETLAAIDAAVVALGRQDLVLGPTEDGGCWLIGLAQRRRTPPGLLAGAARAGDDMVGAILARLPMRLWQVELLALEGCPRLCLGPMGGAKIAALR
ncbi:MAG TPA: DUF2064 domain-containing protein [Stellaceae bacterium]|nr:DUF2064 domain-containing protein [Stellaceae bacterium]